MGGRLVGRTMTDFRFKRRTLPGGDRSSLLQQEKDFVSIPVAQDICNDVVPQLR